MRWEDLNISVAAKHAQSIRFGHKNEFKIKQLEKNSRSTAILVGISIFSNRRFIPA